jgi:cell division protein FtsL
MWRLMHVVAIGALVASAVYVYSIKYKTILWSEKIVETRHAIAREQDAINALRAEYASLTRPERLQGLADKALGMQPLALNQIARPADIPATKPKIDAIGQKIESLGLLGLTATPSTGDTGATPQTR